MQNRIADFGVLVFWCAMTVAVILAVRKWSRAERGAAADALGAAD
jgi:hypothetical protein